MFISNLNHIEVVSESTDIVGGTVVALGVSTAYATGRNSNAQTVSFAAGSQGRRGSGVAFSAGSASGRTSAYSGSLAGVGIF